MARHDAVYKGFRFIVDSIAADDGRFGYQAVVDGKRPIVSAPCGSEHDAITQGIVAAKAKIDLVLQAYRTPR
ncbi:MAG: hypothetical protein ABI564_07875 [Ideonella sp.]